MTEKFDVVALGELLIDFTKNGVSNQGNGLFEACPGGAPCNVLAMLRKLGRKCAFVKWTRSSTRSVPSAVTTKKPASRKVSKSAPDWPRK